MAFWLMFFFWAASFAVSQLLAPKPDIEHAKAATLDQFTFPTATEGRIIPLGWGTFRIRGPNVIWYGDYLARPITEKINTSLFNSKRITIGHNYYLGIQFGLCLGPVALRKIWIGDELVWSGNQATDGDITIDEKEVRGTFSFYTGSKTQAQDPYLAVHQSPCPGYRNLSYGVLKQGFVGPSTSIKPWSFEVSRIPTGYTSYPTVNTYDANLMEVAAELLTNTEWGYGYSAAEINTTDFSAAGATLYNEGNGFSYVLQQQMKATQLLAELERQGDMKFRIDPTTGKWRVALARDGYSLPSLRTLDSTNLKEVVDFSRGGWEQTINSVRIGYERRSNNYGTSYAPAQDGANLQIQGRVVPATWTYPGVKDDALANKVSWRELRSNSYPLAKGRFKVDRSFWDAYVGEVFALTYTIRDLTITNLPMRITRLDTGNKKDPEILVDAVQDVFSWRAASFADPDTTSWVAPVKTLIPFPTAEQLAFEAPYAISRRDLYPSEGRIWVTGENQGRGATGFTILQRNGSGTPSGSYYNAGGSQGFAFTGVLDGAVDNDDTTIDITTDMNVAEILATTINDIGNNLTNLVLIGDEFVSCTGASVISGGIQLTGCYRGLLDSAQQSHADAVDVWFINAGGDLTDTAFTITHTVDLKLLPFDQAGNQVSDSDGALVVLQETLVSRERRPYPPTFAKIGGVQYPSSGGLDSQWGSTEDTKGLKIEWNRRDFRIYDELSQYAVDASTINSDFPTNNTTEYAVEVWNDPDGTPTLLFTTGWDAAAPDYAYRTEILRYTDGVIPTRMRIKIKTRHTHTTVVYEATQTLDWDFDITSTQFTGDKNWGTLAASTASSTWTAPDTGTYAFAVATALNASAKVQARINSGSWVDVITAGGLAGNLVGVTAADTIEVQHDDSTTGGQTLLTVGSPTSAEDAYAILALNS